MSKKLTRLKRDGEVPVQACSGLTCQRSATYTQAKEMIERGAAEPLNADLTGVMANWESRKNFTIHGIKLTLPANRPSMASTITISEMLKNAGAKSFTGDRSLTKNLSLERRERINAARAERGARPLPDEDFAELATGKVDLYPEIFDRRAVMVPAGTRA